MCCNVMYRMCRIASTTAHHITSRHVTSHHITSHRVASHHITSRHITSHHITSPECSPKRLPKPPQNDPPKEPNGVSKWTPNSPGR